MSDTGSAEARAGQICAVVVTFRFPYPELNALLNALHGQVAKIWLVDNNPSPDRDQLAALSTRYSTCSAIVNQANLGLSRALNQGIRAALEDGFDWVMLFDQDSCPEHAMISRLLAARAELEAGDAPIAAIGPAIFDDRMRGPLPFIRFRGFAVTRTLPRPDKPELIDADMLISSGCLLSGKALADVGLMDERLFIDNIDLEWGFRAKAAGYRLVGVSDAVLRHRLGDRVRPVPGTNRNILVHGPVRQYHIMRNRVLLYWRGYVPLSWKVADVPRLLFKLFYFTVLVRPRGENLKMMLRGMWDGVRRR